MSADHERVLAMIEADMRLLRGENEQLKEDLAVALGNPCAMCQAENERLRAERQAVLDCVNLYGDDVLHEALDAIGWPTSTREQPETPPASDENQDGGENHGD
jgi:hypothetical protein